MLNRRQNQIIAFSYLAEKMQDGLEEVSMSDESGIDAPECFRGWLLELDDFADWLFNHWQFKSMIGHNREAALQCFNEMQRLIGLQAY